MRALLALLLVLSGAVPAAAQVEGRYQVASINGQALPAGSPTEPGVVVKRASFWFGPDGRFTVSMTADTREGEDTHDAAGTYVALRDSLRLTGEDGDGPAVAFRWARGGDTLRLYDERENEYRLVLQAPEGAGQPWSPGAWRAVRLNGRELPAPWPPQPQLTITELSFVFTGDGQATAHIVATVGGQSRQDDDTARYAVTGDRLTILDEDGGVDEEYVWTLRGELLELRDANGHTYTFTRVAEP